MAEEESEVGSLPRYCVVCRKEWGPHFLECCTEASLVAVKREGVFNKKVTFFALDGTKLSEARLSELRRVQTTIREQEIPRPKVRKVESYDDDISNALAELITCFGVKEEMPFHDLVALIRKKDIEGCVQEIATRLGLPIRVSLSYVPQDFRPGNSDGFRTSAMARTDWTGHGIEAITAQVSIPQNLPTFGSSGLQGYPIRVRVSENCHAHPETFVTIMVHELSHVLLATMHHPQKDSELHTDLIPTLLGFRAVVERGRKTIQSTTSGNTTTTRTTRYGYLADSQFDFACSHVTGILECHHRDKKRLLQALEEMQRKLKKATRSLAAFRDYFRYVDRHPPERMRKEHAQRVVELHTQDYSREWESRITEARTSMDCAESFGRHLSHYTNRAVEHLKTYTEGLELASDQLRQVTEAIAKDVMILRGYVGVVYRLRRSLWHRS